MQCRIEVTPDPEQAAERAASLVARVLAGAIAERGWASLALAGGKTPRPLYERLARTPYREAVLWEHVEWFWGDERAVPPDHPESNYRLAAETVLSRLPISAERIHRVPTELGPEEAALAYERTIRAVFRTSISVPRFDLVLLGLGSDGHIASLFPHTAALHETHRLVVANSVPRLGTVRITLTPPVIRAARTILVLVTGREKAPAVHRALEDPLDPEDVPAHILATAEGTVVWTLDEAAASDLSVRSGPCPERA
ncbi:MAG: 6-phosphogluconolactonase [Thermomicrobium sp.]|nr:6-phosphogluconolactonase [Thermomicrobium sp.]